MPVGYGLATTPNAAASVGVASGAVVSSRTGRKAIIMANDHATQVIYLSLGGTAVVNQGVRIGPGQVLKLEDYYGAVNAIATGAATTLTYSEY